MGLLKLLWAGNRGFLLTIGLMLVFRSAVADWNYVPSSSMNPTLMSGDRVIVNKLAYSLRIPLTLAHIKRWSRPKRGDIVTFDSPADGLNLIKRVVAISGDRIEMRNNQLLINDLPVPRTLLDSSRLIPTESGVIAAQVWSETIGNRRLEVARIEKLNHLTGFDPVEVPNGHVFVLGDSRDNSNDSRFIGFIDERQITGRAVRVALSHNASMLYLPRSDRWWLPL